MINVLQPIEEGLRILDQTQLPHHEHYLTLTHVDELTDAIRRLCIRGAPLLGVAGAFGVWLGIGDLSRANTRQDVFWPSLQALAENIASSRPTAVNLRHGVQRALKEIEPLRDKPADTWRERALQVAFEIMKEDAELCARISENGAALIRHGMGVLTHCNTGSLATAGIGTALGIIRRAHQEERDIRVFVDETRPVLQGSRLTAWELKRDGIPCTLISDNMAAHLMQLKRIHGVVVGADRIARNGDTANKIGTYALAVLCNYHRLPFYVAAPQTTLDLSIASGIEIPIEERDPDEIRTMAGHPVAPAGIPCANPAFDVTPASLITAIVTERQVYYGPKYLFT
jgi:methylthioribose-1-phosphate isomerase